MDLGGNMDKRDSRGSSVSSTPPTEASSSGGPSGVMRRRGSLFEIVTGREPVAAGTSLSGSDNAINTRHRSFDSRLPKPTPQALSLRRSTAPGVTIVRPTKEARKAEIVAAVTRRLYTARKKPDPRAETQPSLSENAEEIGQIDPKELKLCSNARSRLQEISKRALALGLHRRLRRDTDTQTEQMISALRVKEKSVSTDEPTREIGIETATTACEANFGSRVEMVEKSSQWKAESASIGTQSAPLYPPPLYHVFQPPVYGPPFWLNNWWHNLSWGLSCCHHEPKRRANISVDSADEFSDDSLESLCGMSRVGPDGSSGDTLSEPKPALWETLTLRSGKQFKENSSLYQPDVFRTSHPLASIFQTELSYLGREDKGTETELKTEMDVDEKACNTEPLTITVDEESQTAPCTVHVKPGAIRVPSIVTHSQAGHIQVICDFTVACNSVQREPDPCCSCEPQHLNLPPITVTPEVFQEPTTSASVPQSLTKSAESQTYDWPEAPFSTPDIIAQASNDCKNPSPDAEDSTPQPPPEIDAPNPSESKNGVDGLWERERPFVSLDNALSQHQESNEDSSRARSLDSIFLPTNTIQNPGTNENRPNTSAVKKFRLPCLSENKTTLVPASVTARSIDEVSCPTKTYLSPTKTYLSPTKTYLSPTKRITPSSFLSPKGRRLLLTWLNNPNANPSTGTSIKGGRKTFNGRISRRHAGFREKCHRRVTKRAATVESEKVAVYHNLSSLINEATNYVRTINQSRPQSSEGPKLSVEQCSPKVVLPCEASSSPTPKVQDSSTQSEKSRTVGLSTDTTPTAEKAVSTPERLTTGIQCALNFAPNSSKKTNTFALFWISRSTQTDMSLWNDKYLLADDILLEAQSIVSDDIFNEPVPYFRDCTEFPDRPVNIFGLTRNDEFRLQDRFDSDISTTGYCGRSICSNDLTRGSRLPCRHSSPRAYLQHLVSLRRGIVEACQIPPARPTGVG